MAHSARCVPPRAQRGLCSATRCPLCARHPVPVVCQAPGARCVPGTRCPLCARHPVPVVCPHGHNGACVVQPVGSTRGGCTRRAGVLKVQNTTPGRVPGRDCSKILGNKKPPVPTWHGGFVVPPLFVLRVMRRVAGGQSTACPVCFYVCDLGSATVIDATPIPDAYYLPRVVQTH